MPTFSIIRYGINLSWAVLRSSAIFEVVLHANTFCSFYCILVEMTFSTYKRLFLNIGKFSEYKCMFYMLMCETELSLYAVKQRIDLVESFKYPCVNILKKKIDFSWASVGYFKRLTSVNCSWIFESQKSWWKFDLSWLAPVKNWLLQTISKPLYKRWCRLISNESKIPRFQFRRSNRLKVKFSAIAKWFWFLRSRQIWSNSSCPNNASLYLRCIFPDSHSFCIASSTYCHIACIQVYSTLEMVEARASYRM